MKIKHYFLAILLGAVISSPLLAAEVFDYWRTPKTNEILVSYPVSYLYLTDENGKSTSYYSYLGVAVEYERIFSNTIKTFINGDMSLGEKSPLIYGGSLGFSYALLGGNQYEIKGDDFSFISSFPFSIQFALGIVTKQYNTDQYDSSTSSLDGSAGLDNFDNSDSSSNSTSIKELFIGPFLSLSFIKMFDTDKSIEMRTIYSQSVYKVSGSKSKKNISIYFSGGLML